MNIEDSRKLLYQAHVFFDRIDDDDWDEKEDGPKQMLNMNDTFGWALAFGEEVSDDELVEVARLFRWYGFCGLTYWVSEKNEGMESEFFDVTRGIQFVRKEEALVKEISSDSQRAYKNVIYKLGSSRTKVFIKRMRMKLFWWKIAFNKWRNKGAKK